MTIEFTYYGKVQAKERPRLGKYGVYTPKKTLKSESDLKKQFLKRYPKTQPSKNNFSIIAKIFVEVPKSYTKKKRQLALGNYITPRKPDIDNTLKTVLDSFNNVLWIDDSQVMQVLINKQYSEIGRVEFLIDEIINMVQLFKVTYPLTEKAVQQAKEEYEKSKLSKQAKIDKEIHYFHRKLYNAISKSGLYKGLKENAKHKENYKKEWIDADGYKITIERL